MSRLCLLHLSHFIIYLLPCGTVSGQSAVTVMFIIPHLHLGTLIWRVHVTIQYCEHVVAEVMKCHVLFMCFVQVCPGTSRGIGGHLSKDAWEDEDKRLRFRDGVKKKVQRCQMNFEVKTFLHLVTLWPPHRSKANIVSEDSLEHYVLKHIGWIKHRLFHRVIPERRQVITCVELRGWRLII